MTELEKKLRTLEVSGLWNVEQDQLNKMAEECEEIRTLIPLQSCNTPVDDSPVHTSSGNFVTFNLSVIYAPKIF